MLRAAAPAVTKKALDMVLCDEPDTTVLRALIGKIFPDNLNLGSSEGQALRIVIEKAAERIKSGE